MSSLSSVHSARADSSTPIDRRNKNTVFSTIARIALAALGIMASYAFLPPVGATIASSIIIVVTIMSFFDLHTSSSGSSPTVVLQPADPPMIISPWRRRFRTFGNYFMPSNWFTPSTARREVRRSQSASSTRVPVGDGTPTSNPFANPSFAFDPTYFAASPRAVERVSTATAQPRIPVATGSTANLTASGFFAPPESFIRNVTRIVPGSR